MNMVFDQKHRHGQQNMCRKIKS